uniref:Uncharacterized protein n=1 Tax=Nelumbo nucifera TaxID=4432 RepID=A0A822ZPA6_NELNU|nr:TPA_asm: hypothetical protein HUJ06_002986 [Nelumbo nucifera]
MDELSNSTGPRIEILNNHCREFMQSIKVCIFLVIYVQIRIFVDLFVMISFLLIKGI